MQFPTKDEQLARYRALRRKERDSYGRWVLLIKELRVQHNSSLLDAERIALANAHRRKWVERQINTQQRCRKYALAHIRYNGAASLIEREGNSFRFHIR